jgi:Uma2 family endonuclease
MEARELQRLSMALTVGEYRGLDAASDRKWEYAEGEAWCMAGASPRHNAIVMNVVMTLGNRLRGGPCFPLGSDQKVAQPGRSYFYPDVTVVCGKPAYDESEPAALTNPAVVVEVLSPTTAQRDRGIKAQLYQTLDTLQEYVVVFSDQRRVEHWKRVGEGQWLFTQRIGGDVPLESLALSLSFDEIYEGLERVEP